MAFNPKDHIVKLRGKDYLEVKWRLVWFHDKHPDGSIFTELINHEVIYEEKEVQVGKEKKIQRSVSPLSNATFKATVSLPYLDVDTGAVLDRVFIDYGSEEAGDFGDYIEKASTKAIGRALGLAGFGTQFSTDHDFVQEDGTQKVVDSPVEPSFSFSKSDDGKF